MAIDCANHISVENVGDVSRADLGQKCPGRYLGPSPGLGTRHSSAWKTNRQIGYTITIQL